tara:strand:- start:373 stop:1032 length:660 start_codon:yes stop_codon:yes gene_type:complete
MPDRLERLKEYEPLRIAGRQKRKSILYQKFQTQGKTDLLQNQKPIQKTGLDPNRVHSPNVLPKTSSEFRTEGKQTLLTSKPIKDRGVKVSPVTLKSVIRMAEKKHLGHPKLEGRGQTLTTHTTLENLSDKAKFYDWYRPPMKEKNIKKLNPQLNIQNVDHLKQMDKIQKGGIHHDMKGSKSISKGGGKSGGGGGGKFGIINRALGGRSPWSLLRNNKNY